MPLICAGQPKQRSNPGLASDIDAEAKPLVRLILDSASVVALEVLIVLESSEPVERREIRVAHLFAFLPSTSMEAPAP